jgi:uncharacterized Tic20 family protein
MPKAKPTAAAAMTQAEPAYADTGTADGKGIAIATHVLGMFTIFLGPLVMYFAFRKNASPWLREHLDEAVNYWILVTFAFIALIVLTLVLGTSGAAIFVFLLAFIVVLVAYAFGIISAVKAALGKPSHYPLNIKMIK